MEPNTTEKDVIGNIAVFNANRIDLISFKIIDQLSKFYQINSEDVSKLLVVYKLKQVEVMLKGQLFIRQLYFHSPSVDVLLTLEHKKHNVTNVIRADDPTNGLSFLDTESVGSVEILEPFRADIKMMFSGEFETFIPKQKGISESDDVDLLEAPVEKDVFEECKNKTDPKTIKTMYVASENDIFELSHYLFRVLNNMGYDTNN